MRKSDLIFQLIYTQCKVDYLMYGRLCDLDGRPSAVKVSILTESLSERLLSKLRKRMDDEREAILIVEAHTCDYSPMLDRHKYIIEKVQATIDKWYETKYVQPIRIVLESVESDFIEEDVTDGD